VLNRLGEKHVEAMIERITAGNALSAEVIAHIRVKTDGVPLFVEELTKSVVETAGAQGRALLQPFAIPATLQEALLSRLDRLSDARQVAQLGATLGREFSYELLQAVTQVSEADLQTALSKLVEAEILYQRGMGEQARYFFKHALIQDTAYQSLLKSTRQQLHQQIAQVLEARFLETKLTQPELLAHHYTEAGLSAQAIPYWQRAGERAVERSANVEAITHLTKELELLNTLPDTDERTQQELDLQITLGPALIAIKGWAAPEVEKAYARARELCQQVGETPQLFPVLWGLWGFYEVRAGYQTAFELAEQILTLAQRAQDPALILEAHNALGQILFFLGERTLARAHLDQVIALYDLQQHRSLAFLYGTDPGVLCLTLVAWDLWHLGYPGQALKRSDDALTLARGLSHPLSLAEALFFAAWLHLLRREGQATQERAEAAINLCTEQGFLWLAGGALILQGWALAEQGKREEGIAQIHQGLAAWRASGAEMCLPFYLAMLAEVYGKVGQTEEGLTALAEALATVDRTGERFYEAELYRLKGELTLQQHNVQRSTFKEVEECFHKAIEIARRQQAKSWELRAVISLSRLWQQQGKKKEAHELLSEIYNWFTEGLDTKDLQEAKALLEEVRQ
jgi:predicted ATPase